MPMKKEAQTRSASFLSLHLSTSLHHQQQIYVHTDFFSSASFIGPQTSATSLIHSQLSCYPTAHYASITNKLKRISRSALLDCSSSTTTEPYAYRTLSLRTELGVPHFCNTTRIQPVYYSTTHDACSAKRNQTGQTVRTSPSVSITTGPLEHI